MIYLRQANARGQAEHGWLDSHHTFSFADYYDLNFMGFSVLRVINEDRVQPGEGFPMHAHNDMEILSYVLQGTIEHQDSMGHKERVPAGDFQLMTAGTGIRHSEYNPSQSEPLHFYQIWIIPDRPGHTPRYEQKTFTEKHACQLVLSPDGRAGSLKVHQDMLLWRWALEQNEAATFTIETERRIWIQVISGQVNLNGIIANTSDGVAVWDETLIIINALSDSEILIFDLPNA